MTDLVSLCEVLELPDVREADGDVEGRHGGLLVVLPDGPAQHLGDTQVELGVLAGYRDWDVVNAGPGALQAGQRHLEGEAGNLQVHHRTEDRK